jgi:hypothetical protein
MPRKIHVTNATGRNATITTHGLKPAYPARPALRDGAVRFQRDPATTETGMHDVMVENHGEDYATALIEGDPEIDVELVGRRIEKTDQVYLSSEGQVLYNSPHVVEVILGTDGVEIESRIPEDKPANVNDELPIRWTGRTVPKAKAIRTFSFTRTLQLEHVDGLTYDYLYQMAKELADDNVVVLMRAGADGKQPLIFTMNGTPYQGFLEGRINGEKYKLLLHLSNLELKQPTEEG